MENNNVNAGSIKVNSGKKEKQPVAQARKTLNFKFIFSEIDKPFFMLVFVLLIFGITMMYSASFADSMYEYGTGTYYLKKQVVFAIGGLFAMLFMSILDYHFLQNTKIAYSLFFICLVLSFVTVVFGKSTADASRWLVIGGFRLQPSEFLKLAVIIVFAYILSLNFDKFDKTKYAIGPFAVILGVVGLALILQRHLSAIMLVVIIGITMMFVGGVPRKKLIRLIVFGLIAVALGALLLKLSGSTKFDYIIERFQSWHDPTSDIRDKTAQTYQGLIAIGSGGWFGLGFGNSRQKYLYLPESQNDFIFSIVCEELGFVGAMAVIILFVLFALRGFYLATRAKDRFGMLLATGIVIQIAAQAFLNIAVSCNAFPNTGISLPFFSYGGSALMMQLAEVGILLNISRQSKIKK